MFAARAGRHFDCPIQEIAGGTPIAAGTGNITLTLRDDVQRVARGQSPFWVIPELKELLA